MEKLGKLTRKKRKVIIMILGSLLLGASVGALVIFRDDLRRTRLAEALGIGMRHEDPAVAEEDQSRRIKHWTCPMHPSVKASEPGPCPICGMDLVAVKEEASAGREPTAGQAGAGEIKYWTCSMHPSVKANEPGSCPICGMALIPVTEASASDEGGTESGGPVFTVAPERQQLIGVQFTEVKSQPLEKTIRTVGLVEQDETKVAVIQTKISGWIEKVYVDYTWQHVNQRDPLFTIYSPELVSTQEEYLLALRARDTLVQSRFPDVSRGAKSLLEATRKRLLLWDISPAQIDALERSGEVQRTMTIYSPIAGHVTMKNAFENMRVEPNTEVYRIADHTRVWVHADIYENEISLVKLGQKAEMTLPSYPREVFEGAITYIWPHLDAKTRSLKVRMEFDNPQLQLKPEMYADVVIKVRLGEHVIAPESAVLRTGKRNFVFVDRGQGKLEIRDIELGMKVAEGYQVLKGLSAGERVITAANFLIDAESKLQGVIATWGGGEHKH